MKPLISMSAAFKYLARLIDGKAYEGFSINQTLVDQNIMKAFQKTIAEIQNVSES